MRWRPDTIILYAFDLMHLSGRDLRREALLKRRAILKALLGSDEESRIVPLAASMYLALLAIWVLLFAGRYDF